MIRPRILTDDQVREVRRLYQFRTPGATYKDIARKYGVATSTIRDVIQYRTQFSARVS